MRLSIGVPAYNQGSFLGHTLESLLDQTRPFDEIVVSNNHSTDSTAGVLEQVEALHPGRLRVVVPPRHLSMVENWNFTARHLSGDWISLLSSDDLARPNFAADVLNTIALVPEAAILRAAWMNLKADGSAGEPRMLSTSKLITKPARALYEQRLGPKGSFAAFAVRREVFDEVGGYPEQIPHLGDWGLWLLAGALGDTVLCRPIIAGYRTGHHDAALLATRRCLEMEERFTIYSTILPRATRLAGLGEPAWIARASRESFRRRIVALSRDFPGESRETDWPGRAEETGRREEQGPRAALVEAMEPWAEALGSYDRRLLRRFSEGEVLPTHSYVYSFTRAVFPKLRRLRTWLRGPERGAVRGDE